VRESEVRDIARNGVYANTALRGKLEETHISWVILTRKFAFKIKKPVKLSFLDFSTLQLRKQQCERELLLNTRFSDIYLSVQPIRRLKGKWILGGDEVGDVVDYCVVMRRMAVSKRLDNVLRKGKVNKSSIRRLADQTASFHGKAERVFIPFDIGKACNTFNDIGSIVESVSDNIGLQFGDIINRSIEWSNSFLGVHNHRMQQRIDHGLKRDVHGDLHSGNIFLYRRPVLFDCIEFNDQFRQIDVLYEIAFLCMDFERFHQKPVADIFLQVYTRHFPAFQESEDHLIFTYFKCLRANIRAKVHAMELNQTDDKNEAAFQISETRKYLSLMNEYMASGGEKS
jgi:uncharacterized protein